MSKEMCQSFKAGDLAVYPAHGVGMIMGVETRMVSETDTSFYILKVLDTEATIMVPVDNAGAVGLRKVLKKSQVPKVYAILKEKSDSVLEHQTWNRRYREYNDKIKSGSVLELAKVLRDLYILKFDKELSFGERKMFDTAKNLLIKELSVAKKTKEAQIEEELYRILGG
ncbi:MAG: CarD family transcriptional regulator [Thermodesulfobacteriota bacterium]|nr:MAG: CarD family transcriptional regulator [Thermodesulfobacteriota bacterium]